MLCQYLHDLNVRDALKEKLEFNSYQDLLWGTHEEIKQNLRLIFQNLIFDLIAPTSNYKKIINDILCGYIPYARYLGYYNIIFDNHSDVLGINTKYFYDIDKIELLQCIENYADEAICYLFLRCQDDFEKSYLRFTDSHISFKRWTFRLEEWVKEDLIQVLNKYMPSDNSLGKRITKLITSDYLYIPMLDLTYNSPDSQAIKKLLSATENYICELETIQSIYNTNDIFYK